MNKLLNSRLLTKPLLKIHSSPKIFSTIIKKGTSVNFKTTKPDTQNKEMQLINFSKSIDDIIDILQNTSKENLSINLIFFSVFKIYQNDVKLGPKFELVMLPLILNQINLNINYELSSICQVVRC